MKTLKIKHKEYTVDSFVSICIEYRTRTEIASFYNCAPNTITRVLKDLFPEILEYSSKIPIGERFLLSQNKKTCSSCKSVKSFEEFHKDSHTTTGLIGQCKECRKYYAKNYYEDHKEEYKGNSAKRKAKKLERTPKWADLYAIKEFYMQCPNGYEVDHIIPLQGDIVSGLHVIENLQYLTPYENRSKSNKYEVNE